MRLQGFAEFFDAVQALLDDVQAGGVGESNRAVISKCDSGNDCHVMFGEKLFCKVRGVESKSGDICQDVEGALWYDNGDSGQGAQALHHVLTAHVEFLTHFFYWRLVSLESGESTLLSEGAGV